MGTGGIILATFLVGGRVPLSDSTSATSIKSPSTLLPSGSTSFPLVDAIRLWSILLKLGYRGGGVLHSWEDGGGKGISWLAGGIDSLMAHSQAA